MNKLFPDTIFSRLFLLLFITLTASFLIGREVFLGYEHFHGGDTEHLQHHTFRPWAFAMRLIGIALTAWIAARWLSRPINQMAQAAKELGERLERAPLDEAHGPLEIRQASAVFNQMQTKLRQQISERERFLAAVSHDLRTPLTRLKLRTEKITQPELRENIHGDISEMATMLDATLDFLRGGAAQEDTCRLDVSALVHSLAEDAAELGGTVTVTGTAQPVMAPPMALRRCLNNLIENALRYGARADIKLDDSGDNLVVVVQDGGPGIPDDQLEAVFAPFYRLEQSRSKNTGGVGLGLSISRDIAHKLGGNLILKNAKEGGLAATLTLPKSCQFPVT